jgi:pilus assembly protein Flp/PilA
MFKKMINFFKDEEGATMVEYGLMLALIAVVCITAVGLIGDEANETFTVIQGELAEANGSAGS